MPLASMTGFARAQGISGPYAWAWEMKSVNAKGLDLRLRLPIGWDAVEAPSRAALARIVTRGTISATLTIDRSGAAPTVRVNEEVLAALVEASGKAAARFKVAAPSLDSLLGMKGVIEVADNQENPEEKAAAEQVVVKGFEDALKALVEMRAREGTALGKILSDRIDEIEKLSSAAEANPARKPDAIRAKLAEQIKTLLSAGEKFDADRLHQEAMLLAAKVDIREELDRLTTHVAAVRRLLQDGGPIGRKLDFLAQELNRESNTLCSKANDVSLTAIGLDLKAAVDQFREQVANLE
jgi:uncharacterized protein (TIGR00255 family)